MDYALQPHLYKNVPVYLWPWVWWQLFQIERWIKATGRMVLGGVARDSKVYVLHVADDPNAPKPWSTNDLKPLKGRHQDWIAALSPVHAQREAEAGDQFLLAMQLLEWPLMGTHAACNEPLRNAPPPLAQPPPTQNLPISDCPGLDPGSGPASQDLPHEIPGQARDNRNLKTHPTEPHPRARPHVLHLPAQL